ncbi:hypothetical protein JOF29_005727 [Kribbella aluminosa]|uniref:DUF4240 domain-containing protein n=1 Tax=Kribbella aluminosa TaxID=416017 RepID=A0ABS4USK8_9ACTN|nr:hypothetical protein [Kribbella aluminosa]MBP2354617.1 hypothetical protein [Kribbella aluminosa]
MTDTAACERLLARLVAANWDDDEAEDRHVASRGRLAVEYLRRTAAWANALGVPREWPFFGLAVALDPSVETDSVWMERLEADSGHKLWTLSRKVVTDMFRWASLGDLPKERFPELDDPYEPMIQLLERGGEIWPGHGSIEFYLGSVPYRGIADRLSQSPLPIDPATLDALDEDYRIRSEESRARAAAQRAADSAPPPTREAQ